MNYQNIYNRIVFRAKNRLIIEREYYESHHILPRCMGGKDTIDNLVQLTPSEHFICHLLLSKIYPDNIGLIRAVMWMCTDISRGRTRNKTYSTYKQKFHKYYMDQRLKRNCKICGKEMLVVKNLEKTKKYCSKECLTISNRTARTITINCKNCNKLITKKEYNAKKFCCEKCYTEFRGKNLIRRKPITIKHCSFCKKKMELEPNLKDKKFCSQKCSSNSRKKLN